MRKESRSQARGSNIRQQSTQTRSAETVAPSRKQSKKASSVTPVTYDAPSKDTKSSGKSRSTALSGSSLSPGRSREVKQINVPDVASHDASVSSAVTQQQPDTNVSSSPQDRASSARKEKTAGKTPDKSALRSRRWVRGGPIEYSTPPSDHSSDKIGTESVADKQKFSSDSLDSSKSKPVSRRNIASAFDISDKETDLKQRRKNTGSVPSMTAGAKRKKSPAQQGLTAESKGSLISKGTSRTNTKTSVTVKVEPETTRTKRMATLNAEAIVSLIYKHDEKAAGSSKYCDSSDSDVDTDSSEDVRVPVMKKRRAKTLPSQEDLAGTSKSEEERADRSSSKKRDMHPAAKRSSNKSDKSQKSQTKVSSESCKKKSVEAASSSGWSPPKRMASLNAQVCFCISRLLIKVACCNMYSLSLIHI